MNQHRCRNQLRTNYMAKLKKQSFNYIFFKEKVNYGVFSDKLYMSNFLNPN